MLLALQQTDIGPEGTPKSKLMALRTDDRALPTLDTSFEQQKLAIGRQSTESSISPIEATPLHHSKEFNISNHDTTPPSPPSPLSASSLTLPPSHYLYKRPEANNPLGIYTGSEESQPAVFPAAFHPPKHPASSHHRPISDPNPQPKTAPSHATTPTRHSWLGLLRGPRRANVNAAERGETVGLDPVAPRNEGYTAGNYVTHLPEPGDIEAGRNRAARDPKLKKALGLTGIVLLVVLCVVIGVWDSRRKREDS